VYNMLPSAAVVVLDGQTSPFVTYPLAKVAAMKALAIDPGLAEAHTSLAYATYVFDRDWAAAEAAFQRGIQFNPGYATAHQWYADYLVADGRASQALNEIETAMALDPLSPAIRLFRGAILYSARRYDETIAQAQRALEIEPANAVAYYYRAAAYEQKGQLTEAEADIRRALQLAPRDPLLVAESARVAARMGDAAGALRIARNLTARRRQEGIPSDTIAYIYAALGDKDRAFEFLAQAEQEHWPGVLWAKTLPELDPLRDDPRFDGLLRSLRLAR
jgi:tetratricopeptide (TPR) repeat protein